MAAHPNLNTDRATLMNKTQTISMSGASVPMFAQILTALSDVLDKAEAHAASQRIDAGVLLNARLFPDMYPLVSQVQLACDFAKGATARLAGIKVPAFEDNEQSFAELKERIVKTLAFMRSVDPAQIDGSEAREISLKSGDGTLNFEGQPYLVGFAIPNMLFHATAAYAILRHNGVKLGKRDFIGQVHGS